MISDIDKLNILNMLEPTPTKKVKTDDKIKSLFYKILEYYVNISDRAEMISLKERLQTTCHDTQKFLN